MSANKSSLPPDVFGFVKQFGVNLQGLEPEAREIWNQLNSLSMENPIEYERFVSEQMQLAKEESENAQSEGKSRSFRPTAAFCLEGHSFGGDGAIIRDISSSSANKNLFINFCSSPIIEQPRDKHGRPVNLERETADGLEIPLIVGKVRKISNEANAVDIVFGTQVIELCTRKRIFKQQIIELGLQWLKEESDLKFDPQECREIKSHAYKGGLGDDKDVPVLFHVDDEMLQPPEEKEKGKKAHAKPETKSALDSTQSLLSHLHKEKETVVTESIIQEKHIPTAMKKSSIEKVDKSSVKPLIKEVKKPIIEEVGGKSKPTEKPLINIEQPSNSLGKSENPNLMKLEEEKNSTTAHDKICPPSKRDIKEFQEIFGAFDEDIREIPDDSRVAEDQAITFLADIAKAVSYSATLPTKTKVPLPNKELNDTSQSSEKIIVANPRADIIKLTVQLQDGEVTGNHVLSISLQNLSSAVDINSINLEVSQSEVRVRCPLDSFADNLGLKHTEIISVKLKNNDLLFNPAKSKASFKRKSGIMTFIVCCDSKK